MATAIRSAQICRNYINGQSVASKSGRTMERRNPANLDEVVAVVPLSTREEVREAIAAAKAAFPAWRDMPAPARGKIIAKAAALLTEQKDEVARLLTHEEGKIFKESLVEVQRAINIVEFMSGEGRRLGGQTLPSELPKTFAYTIKQPLGVVGAITPWNFPVAIPLLESRSGADHRQHDDTEAGGTYTANSLENGRDFHSGWAAPGSIECRAGRRRGRG